MQNVQQRVHPYGNAGCAANGRIDQHSADTGIEPCPESAYTFSFPTGAANLGNASVTFSPLKGMPGVPTRVVMELSHKDGEIFLHYEERNEEIWEIARWKGSDGGFSYLDTKGRWHEQWPPGLEKTNQLPEGIFLEAHDPRGSIIWFAAVSGLRNPKPRLRDLLGNF